MGLRQSAIINRPKAALAEAARRGERFGGTAEKGVGESMGRFGISRGSAFPGNFTEQNNEKEKQRESGGGSGNDWRNKMTGKSSVMGLY